KYERVERPIRHTPLMFFLRKRDTPRYLLRVNLRARSARVARDVLPSETRTSPLLPRPALLHAGRVVIALIHLQGGMILAAADRPHFPWLATGLSWNDAADGGNQKPSQQHQIARSERPAM